MYDRGATVRFRRRPKGRIITATVLHDNVDTIDVANIVHVGKRRVKFQWTITREQVVA